MRFGSANIAALKVGSSNVAKIYLGGIQIYPALEGNIIYVGTGSGDLIITQANTGAVNGDTILVAAGTYNYIIIKDFDLPQGEKVSIKNNGTVNVATGMVIENTAGITINGDYISPTGRGFVFNDISYRAIEIYGDAFTRVTISNMTFNNVAGYSIIRDTTLRDVTYDGTAATRGDDIKFLNLDFNNCGELFMGGQFNTTTSTDTGHLRNFEMSGCTFTNSDAGTFLSMGNVDGYNIHHNIWSDLNATNNLHNGMCIISGSGKFHHNKSSNYQGNAIRARGFSRGTTPKKIQLYNNICNRTRKYSGLEVQSFDYYLEDGVTTTAIFEVFHNTVYDMHYEDYGGSNYVGVILDKYAMFGSTVEAWNNVGIHFLHPETSGGGSYLWGQGAPDNVYGNSNRYYANLATAGLSEDGNFEVLDGSPLLSGDYRVNPETIDDYYGNPRIGVPTISAVQSGSIVPTDDVLLDGSTRLVLPNPPFTKTANKYVGDSESGILNLEIDGNGYIATRYESDARGGFYLRPINEETGNYVGFFFDEVGTLYWEYNLGSGNISGVCSVQPTLHQYVGLRKTSGNTIGIYITDDGITFNEATTVFGTTFSDYKYLFWGGGDPNTFYDPQGVNITVAETKGDILLSGATRFGSGVFTLEPNEKSNYRYAFNGATQVYKQLVGEGYFAVRFEADSNIMMYLCPTNDTAYVGYIGIRTQYENIYWEDVADGNGPVAVQPPLGDYVGIRRLSDDSLELISTPDGIIFTSLYTFNTPVGGTFAEHKYLVFETAYAGGFYDPQGVGLTDT